MPWDSSPPLQVGDVVSIPTEVWPWWLGRKISKWIGLLRVEQRLYDITAKGER